MKEIFLSGRMTTNRASTTKKVSNMHKEGNAANEK